MSRNNGRNTVGTFAKGNSGRPKGACNKTTQAIATLLYGEAEAITRKAIEMALDGDGLALRTVSDASDMDLIALKWGK